MQESARTLGPYRTPGSRRLVAVNPKP